MVSSLAVYPSGHQRTDLPLRAHDELLKVIQFRGSLSPRNFNEGMQITACLGEQDELSAHGCVVGIIGLEGRVYCVCPSDDQVDIWPFWLGLDLSVSNSVRASRPCACLVRVDRCRHEQADGHPSRKIALHLGSTSYPQDHARFGLHWQI